MVKDVRKIKTERDIQQALLTLLTQKTVRQITVADICQTSLTSRSTFYAHYIDKYDLLENMVAVHTTMFAQQVHVRFMQMIDGQIDELVQGLLADMADKRPAIQILFTIHEDHADLQANFRSLLLKEWQRFIAPYGDAMQVPADLMATMGTNVQMTVLEWTLAHGDVSNAAVADAIDTIRKAVLLQIQPATN
ncbi:TetR/AcrR family transcriptional regulator [Lactiplantibacillus songbeiensis]|uniref:TetR/AcrR family transcriptional regulator n=1 Tax=Lactiplantibacillus songbeiensis TaxID=2559920 RepID=A0ABW4C206_9LACO|nr:TetR/AcrR family transcriptional regulator [Lactiplantibacillus songbeiensis]